MNTTVLRDLRSNLAAIDRLYNSTDEESARLRAAHLGTVLGLTPYCMAANVGSALLVVAGFGPEPPNSLWLWLAALLAIVAAGTLSWMRQPRLRHHKVSTRSVKRATLNAAVLATAWAALTVGWFPGAEPAQQLILATTVTGMLGAGSFLLSALPRASLIWASLFAGAGLCALWLSDDPAHGLVAVLLAVYTPTVAIGSMRAWQKSTALLRTEADSARQQQMLSLLLQDFEQGADEALWETGPQGYLNHSSPRLDQLLGLDAAATRTLPFAALIQRCSPQGAGPLRQALDGGRPFRDLVLPVPGPGGTRHLSINGKRLFDERGQTLGWRGVMADVTAEVDADEQLRQLAHTDSLTGLANRFQLREAMAHRAAQGQPFALVALDLDHFKSINDSLGHAMGDAVLLAVAHRLQACVRPGDLVARLGGDEFAVLPGPDSPAATIHGLAQRLVEALAEPIDLEGRRLRTGTSVGVALCDEPGISVDELLVRADTALYAAKADGRGRYALYTAPMGESSKRRAAIEEGLRHAIELGQLELHWQPKVDVNDSQVTGAECLMRWQHPQLGPVTPGEFIGVAEQAGLIDTLGQWALREACRAAAGSLSMLVVSVNVSPLQLRDGQFVTQVRDALREFALDPSRLELEITESVFMNDADGALEQLHAVRGLGVRVALDDFGTGYSSLAYLRRFPFDTLKIDRAFIQELLVHKDARAIVVAISQLATVLGMRTVCEGVENRAQLQVVARTGCHEVQGYLVAAPMPLAEFRRFVAAWQQAPGVQLSAVH